MGYADAGMNVRLATAGANGNIHWYGGTGIPTGLYAPDGRRIDPLSSPEAFDTAGTEADLTTFNGLDPTGSWSLFVADVSDSGGQTTVLSWGLQIDGISPVPEPVNGALAIFGALAALAGLARRTLKSLSRQREVIRTTPADRPGCGRGR